MDRRFSAAFFAGWASCATRLPGIYRMVRPENDQLFSVRPLCDLCHSRRRRFVQMTSRNLNHRDLKEAGLNRSDVEGPVRKLIYAALIGLAVSSPASAEYRG